MWDRLNELYLAIEEAQSEVAILLNMANITLEDYILIKRGSKDYPEGLSMSLLEQIDEQIDIVKKSIDGMNKVKRDLLVF